MLPRIRIARVPLACLVACGVPAQFGSMALAAAPRKTPAAEKAVPTPAVSTDTLPGLLQRGAQAFAAGDFPQAAEAFRQAETSFGKEAEWRSGTLPRRLLPLRGFAELRAGDSQAAAEDLALFVERYPDEQAQRGFVLFALALALEQSGNHEEALARFAQFEDEQPDSAQAALARLQRAEICFTTGRADDGFSLLRELWSSSTAAETLRTQARLRALEHAIEADRIDLATELLFSDAWTVSSMPEIGLLAFSAMEVGDRMLAAARPSDAIRAYQLVPPKHRLVAAQAERLETLRRLITERAPDVQIGAGLFWVDYYQARLARLTAQLEALRSADDYTAPLRLRLGQAMLLAHRAREAWLCFESLATAEETTTELRQEAHYRWILAAADLARWNDALVIARGFVDRYPASDLAPEAFFLISRAHLEGRDYPAAEVVLTDILNRFPSHPAARRARFTRGWVRTMRESYPAAREDFEACAAAAPDSALAVQAGLWRGLTYHFAREREKALSIFDELIASHPRDPLLPEILYRRGATLYAMRDLPRARSQMEQFVSTYPLHERHAEALLLLGDVLMGEGTLEEALHRFAEIPPEAADAFVYAAFQTGKILRATHDHRAMIDHFSRYVRTATERRLPRVSDALYQLGWAHEQLGNAAAALPLYAEALDRFGNDPASGEVGATLTALQRLARRLVAGNSAGVPTAMAALARDGFDRWLEDERDRARTDHRDTYFARLSLCLADLHQARKEPAQAEALTLGLSSAVPVEALDATALARVGAALLALGADEARGYFERILTAYPHSIQRGDAFHGLATLACRQRRFADALAWISRFEDTVPTHPLGPQAALLAGEALEALGKPAAAAERYEALLQLRSARGRPHAEALAGLARCAQADGDVPRAIACYQRLYTLHRAQRDLAAEAYLASAPLFDQLGDAAAAAATYREMLALADVGDPQQRERASAALHDLEARLAAPAAAGTEANL